MNCMYILWPILVMIQRLMYMIFVFVILVYVIFLSSHLPLKAMLLAFISAYVILTIVKNLRFSIRYYDMNKFQ